MFHVIMSNIFLFNYLVAILTTVYSEMQEKGEFDYKTNRYKYIEKYSIAFLDSHGYSELILHPPPLNVFSIFLIPMVIRKSLMKRAADVFAKFSYWLENIFYIGGFFLYEMILWPIIYFKMTFLIFSLSSCLKVLPYFLMWLVCGFFFLFYATCMDIFYMIKILCDYQDEEDQFNENQEEDFKQDRIVIYNEVIDVMRSIVHIFKKKKDDAKKKKLLSNN